MTAQNATLAMRVASFSTLVVDPVSTRDGVSRETSVDAPGHDSQRCREFRPRQTSADLKCQAAALNRSFAALESRIQRTGDYHVARVKAAASDGWHCRRRPSIREPRYGSSVDAARRVLGDNNLSNGGHRMMRTRPSVERGSKPAPQGPTVFVSRSLPRPSAAYATIWKFAAARHDMYMRRMGAAAPPWTTDPILRGYRFTNAFRAADRVSQVLIELTRLSANESAPTVMLRVLLFKIFNKIETWNAIVGRFGMPDAASFPFDQCDVFLRELRTGGKPIYSCAYIMPSCGATGEAKHSAHLRLLRSMLHDGLPSRLERSGCLSEVYDLLRSYPSLGPFLAFQYAIDLNYSSLIDHREEEFVVPGPGALDGLSKCFVDLGDYSPTDAIHRLADVQEEEFARHGQAFGGLWGRRLQPIDVQNVLCEVSKYTRISHPEIRGLSGRTRIKQRFTMAGALPDPAFPMKWNLQERVSQWRAALRLEPQVMPERGQLEFGYAGQASAAPLGAGKGL